MNYGVSSMLHIGLGIYQACFNIVLLIPISMFYRKSLGIGTIVNMFLLGYVVQFFMSMFNYVNIKPEIFYSNILMQGVLLVEGFVVSTFGASLYMECDNGIGPYDALGQLIELKTKIPFKYARIGIDFCSAIIGFVSGQIVGVTTIGIATMLFVFGTGPIVTFFREKIMCKIVA